MLKSVFIPNQYNSYAWANALCLMLLLCLEAVEAYTVIFAYFLETIVIGAFNIIRMLMASKHDSSGNSIVFLVPFFIFHYGMFVAVQSVFAFALFSFSGQDLIKEPFDLIDNYITILKLEGMAYILPLLIGTQLLKLIFDFILSKKYMDFTASEMMFKPYVRIVIQQFTVLIAMFFIVFSNSAVVAAILLIGIRTVVDLFMAAIRDNERVLNIMVDKLDNGKMPKSKLKKQLLLFSE